MNRGNLRSVPFRTVGKILLSSGFLLCLTENAKSSETEKLKTDKPKDLAISISEEPPPGFEHLIQPREESIEKAEQFTFSEEPPPGFEAFSENNSNQIDVFFEEKQIASVLADYNSKHLSFSDAESIISAIGTLREPDRILKVLRKPLLLNTNYDCSNSDDHNCALLKPQIAEIVFSESRFRADLYINPAYLVQNMLESEMFLPEPNRIFSSIHRFSINSAGGENRKPNHNSTINSIFAYGKKRLNSYISSNSTNHALVNSLFFEADHQRWRTRIGTLNTHATLSPLFKTRDYTGFSFSRILDLRTDLKLVTGTPLYIFLNQRSLVSVYRDSRLLDTRFYDAGNQQLDTARLPDGNYNITVIIDENGIEKREEFLFNRSTLLPPKDHAMHFLDAGFYRNNENRNSPASTGGSYFIQLGSRFRLQDNLGAEIQASSGNNQSATIQASLYRFQPGLLAFASILGNRNGLDGYSTNILWQFERNNLTLNYQKLDEYNGAGDFQEDSKLLATGKKSSITIGRPIFSGNVKLQWSEINDVGTEKQRIFDLSYRKTVFKTLKLSMDVSLNFRQTDDDNTLYLTANLARFNDRNRKSLSFSANTSETGKARVDTRIIQPMAFGKQSIAQNTYSLSGGSENDWLGGLRVEADTGKAHGFVETRVNTLAGIQTSSYVAGMNSMMVSSGKKAFFASKASGNSGVLIDVKGASDIDFDIQVNNQIVGSTKSNQLAGIVLQPYKFYNINLISKGESLISIDEQSRKISLFPGNIDMLEWKANPVYALVSQATYKNGDTVPNARITNLEEFSATDEDGWFQVEIHEEEKLMLQPTGPEPECTIHLQKAPINQEVVVFDSLICEVSDAPNPS